MFTKFLILQSRFNIHSYQGCSDYWCAGVTKSCGEGILTSSLPLYISLWPRSVTLRTPGHHQGISAMHDKRFFSWGTLTVPGLWRQISLIKRPWAQVRDLSCGLLESQKCESSAVRAKSHCNTRRILMV